MKDLARFLAVGVVSLLCCPLAVAQDAQSPAPSNSGEGLPPVAPSRTPIAAPGSGLPPTQCQLRVWSTTKMKSYVTGFAEAMGGGLLGAALDGKRANAKTVQGMLQDALGGRHQAALLARVDLAATFRMPGVVVVPAATPSDPKEWKRAKGRLTADAGECYGEIIVRDLYFLKTALFPPTVRVNFTFRDFRGGRATPLVVEGRGGVSLPVYPTVSTIDEAVITRAFQDAYVGAFEEFVQEQKIAGSR